MDKKSIPWPRPFDKAHQIGYTRVRILSEKEAWYHEIRNRLICRWRKSTTTLVKHKMSTAYTNGPCSSFSYGQTVPCLLVIAIGGILTKIFLNALVQIETHGFRICDPETANAVPLARNPILARGGAERFQQIFAGNRHNALLFTPRLGELKALRLTALAHTDCKHLCLASSRHST